MSTPLDVDTRPKVVVLSGSSRFVDVMAVCAWLIERDEHSIATGLHLLPVWYPNVPDHHLAEAEGVASKMDELHLRKIDLADEMFIVNCNDYIGESTRREIEYAKKLGKPLRWFTHDPIGEAVTGILRRHLAPEPETDAEKARREAHAALVRYFASASPPESRARWREFLSVVDRAEALEGQIIAAARQSSSEVE